MACSGCACSSGNKTHQHESKNKKMLTIGILAVSLLALIASFFNVFNLPVDIAWVAIILCGLPIIKNAVIGLFTRFDIKADVLVSIALVAAVIIDETFAAGEVAFIMTIGMYLEEMTLAKAHAGIQRLIDLTPKTARLVQNGAERTVNAESVQKNDLVRVLPGETVPVDGVIIKGSTSINQSLLTGESLPVDKTVNDEVFGGTVNQFGAFDMRATKVGQDSSLARMIKLVESADAGRSRIVSVADRWATVIVAAALLCAVVTGFVTGEAIRAVTVLVVFCPCALVLATPTAIMAAIGNAARNGILISQGDALERLAQVSRIAFDKTGTLTYGTPTVAAVQSLNSNFSENELARLTAGAEMLSEHPLGKAATSYVRNVLKLAPPQPQSFKMQAGRGVTAGVEGRSVLAGSLSWLQDNAVNVADEAVNAANIHKAKGFTVIYVAVDGVLAGIVAFSDVLRENSPNVVKNIHSRGLKTTLITGDMRQAADYMAQSAGVGEVFAECMPAAKIEVIKNFQNKKELVCMIGDGVNDAPALKTAHVGVAMGGIGSDIAIDAADIVLVGDNIGAVPHLLRLAKKAMRTIHANIIMAMGINFIAVILAMLGLIDPVIGALIHNGGSVLVILNSILLLKYDNREDEDADAATHKPGCTCVICLQQQAG